MANDGVLDSGLGGNNAERPSHALGMPIAVAPDEMTIVKLSGCRDKTCAFFGDQVDPWAASVGQRAGSSSTSVTPKDPGSAGFPSLSSIGTAALQLQAFPGLPAAAPLRSPYTSSVYSPSAAVAYARKWALGANPDYEHFGSDCTSFVSQALFVGGWDMIQSADVCEDVTDDTLWWYRRDACWHLLRNVHCSNTWAVASHLFWFLCNSNRASGVKSIWDLEPGDILQKDYADDYVKHSMMVTQKTDDNIYLSYHSDDHLDEPFFGPGGILNRNYSKPACKWYGFHIL